MKNFKLSLVLVATMALGLTLNAQSLQEALQNGKVTGDFTIRYETRNTDTLNVAAAQWAKIYYQDTGYAVGSIGLEYKSEAFYNFSVAVGLRAHTNIWENDSDSITWQGIGDSSERYFDEAGNVMLSNAYLGYDLDHFHIKAGRQNFYTEWVGKTHDAVSVYTSPIENSTLELIWTKRGGRVHHIEARPIVDLNENKGVYKAGFEYRFSDYIKVKPYYLSAPDKFNLIGGKITLDATFEDASIGTLIHVIQTNEKENGKLHDGEMIELKLYGQYANFFTTLGYVQTGEESGWGSANTAGETVVPFEEADPMYLADARTWYLSISKKVGPVNLTALYGEMKYTSNDYKESEFDLWSAYNITAALRIDAGFTITSSDDKDLNSTDLTQFNTTIMYKF